MKEESEETDRERGVERTLNDREIVKSGGRMSNREKERIRKCEIEREKGGKRGRKRKKEIRM